MIRRMRYRASVTHQPKPCGALGYRHNTPYSTVYLWPRTYQWVYLFRIASFKVARWLAALQRERVQALAPPVQRSEPLSPPHHPH